MAGLFKILLESLGRIILTQCEKILNYIKSNGSITPLDALREFGCMRLASRITDIKAQGYDIISKLESNKNRYGDTVRYARYTLKGGNNE